jgi:hypothetical protein
VLTNAKPRQYFHRDLFHGFDFDNTMLRIGSMNMLLHGVENPDVVYTIVEPQRGRSPISHPRHTTNSVRFK